MTSSRSATLSIFRWTSCVYCYFPTLDKIPSLSGIYQDRIIDAAYLWTGSDKCVRPHNSYVDRETEQATSEGSVHSREQIARTLVLCSRARGNADIQRRFAAPLAHSLL